jgi:hypothetical protein
LESISARQNAQNNRSIQQHFDNRAKMLKNGNDQLRFGAAGCWEKGAAQPYMHVLAAALDDDGAELTDQRGRAQHSQGGQSEQKRKLFVRMNLDTYEK